MMLYGERCWTSEVWGRSIIFNATRRWFPERLKRFPSLQLRAKDRMRLACPRLQGLSGWHMTYFMDTAHTCSRSFTRFSILWRGLFELSRRPKTPVPRWKSECARALPCTVELTVLTLRAMTASCRTSWVGHVMYLRLAPRAQLLAENTTHAVSLLAEEAKAARVATAPSDQHWLVESNLRKARGRLAATMAELRLRGLSTAAPPTNQPPSVRAGRTDTDTR